MKHVAKILIGVVILALAAEGPASCQQRSGRHSKSASSQSPGGNDQNVNPNFAGLVRGIDDKMLLLETKPGSESEDANTMQIFLTKKTRYLDGDKKIRQPDIKLGDRVLVDAGLGPDGKPEAVTVRIDRQKP